LNTQEYKILAVTGYGHFMAHFNMLVFPAMVLPLTRQLNLELTEVLSLSFVMYLLFGLTALPWGLAADRWSAKSLMLVFFLGAGLSNLAAAFWINSPVGLTVALAGVGLFSGIYHPIGLGLISKGVRQVSLAMGYNGMSGNLGLACAPFLAGIFTWIWGLKAAFLAVCAINLVGLGLMGVLSFDEAPDAAETESETQGKNLIPFLFLLAAMMLGGISYRGAIVVLPAFIEIRSPGLMQALSGLWSETVTGTLVATSLTSFIFLIGILGQYIGGHIGNRFEPRYSYLLFHLFSLPAIFLMTVAQNLPLVGIAIIYFFFLMGLQPIENTLVAGLTPHKFHHSAYGFKFILTFGVGSLAVKMVGFIEGSWGLQAVFPTLGFVTIILIGSVVFLIITSSSLHSEKINEPSAG